MAEQELVSWHVAQLCSYIIPYGLDQNQLIEFLFNFNLEFLTSVEVVIHGNRRTLTYLHVILQHLLSPTFAC